MNALDIVILAVVALFTLYGLKKGFIISLATLGGMLLGIYAAILFSNYFSGLFRDAFHPPTAWIPALSFSLTFLVVVIGVYFLGKALESLVNMTGMGIINHAAGAVFGFAKGVLLLSVVFFLIALADQKNTVITPGARSKSLFYNQVKGVFPYLMRITRADLKIPS